MLVSCVNKVVNKKSIRRLSTNITRDAFEGAVKYSPVILSGIGLITLFSGFILEISWLQNQITLTNEKINLMEIANDNRMIEYSKTTDEKMKTTDEKINASVEKCVRVAMENFFKYSYSSEFKSMRQAKD